MKSTQGQLLVATRKLLDPNFFHSVVLVVQHGEEGALGLILNRPTDIPVKRAWEQVNEIPCRDEGLLLRGGPCDGPLMVLHTRPEYAQVRVAEGVYFATDKESVERLVDDNVGPMRFFVGYSGWSPGQLDDELSDDGWVQVKADADTVFAVPDQMWEKAFRAAARAAAPPWLNPKFIPDDPSLN